MGTSHSNETSLPLSCRGNGSKKNKFLVWKWEIMSIFRHYFIWQNHEFLQMAKLQEGTPFLSLSLPFSPFLFLSLPFPRPGRYSCLLLAGCLLAGFEGARSRVKQASKRAPGSSSKFKLVWRLLAVCLLAVALLAGTPASKQARELQATLDLPEYPTKTCHRGTFKGA